MAYDIFLKVESVNRISIIIVCRANNKRCYYEARSRKCDCYYEICAFHSVGSQINCNDGQVEHCMKTKQNTCTVLPLVPYLNRSREHKLREEVGRSENVLVAGCCYCIRPHQIDAHDVPGSVRLNWMKLWCCGQQFVGMLALRTFFHLYCKNQDKVPITSQK